MCIAFLKKSTKKIGIEVAAGGVLGMMQYTITNQNNQDWQNRFDILSRQRQEESAVRMQHNAYLEHNRMKSANLKADLDALRKNGMNIGLMYEGNGAGGQTIASSGTNGGNPIPMSGEGLSRGTIMGIEMANVNADLDLKAAQAEALRADAAYIVTGKQIGRAHV